MSGCTARTTTGCTGGPTPTTTFGGGLTASGNGRLKDVTCTPTSTTTAAGTPYATLERCTRSWPRCSASRGAVSMRWPTAGSTTPTGRGTAETGSTVTA